MVLELIPSKLKSHLATKPVLLILIYSEGSDIMNTATSNTAQHLMVPGSSSPC